MDEIILNTIDKKGREIQFDYEVHGEITKYFTEKHFAIEYPDCVEKVPDSIACIPFVCNVLPIIWLTDSVLVLPELDKAFYESIPEFKAGYVDMFPETNFKGTIVVDQIIENHYLNTGKAAMFYSGGLDSVQTLISHLDERPVLLAVWGSDIQYDNEDGWRVVHEVIKDTAQRFQLQEGVIHSTFREFDNEILLGKSYSEQLKDNWWHGLKHSIGLLGHVAPYAWIHKINIMYFAASNCPADGKVRCASDPSIDNHVKFEDCNVIHDGFEYSRQDKVHNIVEFCKKKNEYFPLHVCWQSQTGSNCCHCEKCYRTMSELMAEGENPENFGFYNAKTGLKNMRYFLIANPPTYKNFWIDIRERASENWKKVCKTQYYKEFKWILKADFEHPETLRLPLSYTIRGRLAKFKVYQWFHKVKTKLAKESKNE